MPHAELPDVVWYIVEAAKRDLGAQTIYLFGSRAKGTAHAKSDVDMAFVPSTTGQANWSRFVADVEEAAPTLLELDLVNLERCPAELRDEIVRTGVRLLGETKQ